MESLPSDEKVIEVYHLVPLPPESNIASGRFDLNNPVLPGAGIQSKDQTYLVLPFHSPVLPVSCLLASKPSAPEPAAINNVMDSDCGRHSCTFCSLKFTDIDELLVHKRRMHIATERPSSAMCIICSKHFSSEIHLEFHMTSDHKGHRPYRCEFCSRKYANLTSLDVHILEDHPNKLRPYACGSCMASFAIKTELIAHLHDEHKQMFVCQFCVKNFRNASLLKRHEVTHTRPITLISAEIDVRRFGVGLVGPHSAEKEQNDDESDEGDEKEETDEPSNIPIPNVFRCPLCDETFLERSNQANHVLCHSDEAPFECPDCGNLFQDIEMFQGHMQAHDYNIYRVQLDQQAVEALGNINYDEIHHNIDSLLNNSEFHDFDEEQDHNYDDIMTNLKRIDSKETDHLADEKQHEKQVPETLDKIVKSEVQLTKVPKPEVINLSPLPDISVAEGSANKDPLESDPIIQPNKRPPVSVDWQKTDKKIRNHKCTTCNRSFTLARTLALHNRRTHLGIKPYGCLHCGWKFAQSSDLIKHTRKHTGEKPFGCDYCDTSFTQKRNLKSHMKMHTEKPSQCQYCLQSFFINDNLRSHLRKHEGANAQKCTDCGVPYVTIKDMEIHRRKRHFQPAVNNCSQCGKSFERPYDLKMHMAIHTGTKYFNGSDSDFSYFIFVAGDRPFKCAQCPKTFTQATSLRNHQIGIHTSERAFQCSKCGKHFAFLGNLKTHMRIHSNERHFACTICVKTFSRLSSLTEHRKIHFGIKTHKCDECDKAFINSSAYLKHKQIHSGLRPHRCHICERDFVQSSHLTKHLRTHTKEKPFMCQMCAKTFHRADSLTNHLKVHEKKVKVTQKIATKSKLRSIRSKAGSQQTNTEAFDQQIVAEKMPEQNQRVNHVAQFNASHEFDTNPPIVYTFTASDIANLPRNTLQQFVEPLVGQFDSNYSGYNHG